ncbi:thiamine diphosphokinase [Streptococcus catagoni]|uniref:thiamine diphosphokinase n=1 Tax=Streptococcus catagoni TaxID=2654874 RepID=UPI00140BC2A1|nr:thiamine diphosphokinase [Streptococcus catagoni]
MTKVALFAGGPLRHYRKNFDYFVGVDAGSLFLLRNGLPLDMAVGDFDSVSAEEFSNIKERAKELIVASADKNDTDTELALKSVFARDAHAQVTIFGAFGGRLDHFLSNVFIPNNPDLAAFMTQIRLEDKENILEYRPQGSHSIEKIEGMDYVSFMTDGDADLSIYKAKFELRPDHFFKKKIYSSNEFLKDSIEVSVNSGYILIIHSKDWS